MTIPVLASVLAVGLAIGVAAAADGGARAHAQGPYDPAAGTYTVVGGDALGAIAGRFGLTLGQLERQNDLDTDAIRIGQVLNVGAVPSPVAPALSSGGGQAPGAQSPTPARVAQAATGGASAGAGGAGAGAESPTLPPDPWPRKLQADGRGLLLYQPQVVEWTGNRLTMRAAVAVQPGAGGEESFGTVAVQTRTQVDRVQRLAVLEGLSIVGADFPTLPDRGAALAKALGQTLAGSVRVIPLDRLEASLAMTQSEPTAGVAVKNDPPRVIVSDSPAVLVPIQGAPVTKPVAGTQLQRVVNTRACILVGGPEGAYYLHLLDGWVTAPTLDGPWTRAEILPAGLDATASRLAAEGRVDLLDGAPQAPNLALIAAGIPAVYVTQTPAELLVFKGQPNLVPVQGTGLLWATNASGDVLVDTADSRYYVLLAGRWFRGPSLEGPWDFVASDALPADFKRIPPGSPAGAVLASVAGTPQAREALIANSIPQTATVARTGGPTFAPVFDGPAEVSLLAGTQLEYVINTETPIVRSGFGPWYGLEAGVWFESQSLEGPWAVASAVPESIYAIPPSSPLHYATYVRIYGSTPEAVYVGYTPGYLGTVAAPDGVVVYGTGYDYRPWIGNLWYAAPETYGLAAMPVYNPAVGYGYGFGLGLATAAAAEPYWGGAYYRPYAAGYACCGTTSANVYRRWGETVAAGSRTWYDTPSGTLGTAAAGSYADLRTGTAGTYAAGRSFNPYTGVAREGYGRTFDTASGVDGQVARGERYNPATGVRSYGSEMSATGPEGSTVSRETRAVQGPLGGSAAAHQTTVDNARTGQSHTVDTARVGNNLYAGADGNVYRNTGDGWERAGAGGWQAAEGDTAWADREQQARNQGQDRWDSLSQGGWGGRVGGDAYADVGGTARYTSDGLADRFGGGGDGFADRFGAGGFGGGDAFGDRFGGGGFADRFGGGGFGGRFGGFRR